MFWQQRTGSPAGAGDPRMKMMGYLMPIIFTFMFYRFPSGLVLYWLVNTVLTIAQQYLVTRNDRTETVETVITSRKRKGRRAGGAGSESPSGTPGKTSAPPVAGRVLPPK